MRCSRRTSDHGMSQLTSTAAVCRSMPSLPASVETIAWNSPAANSARMLSRSACESRPEYLLALNPALWKFSNSQSAVSAYSVNTTTCRFEPGATAFGTRHSSTSLGHLETAASGLPRILSRRPSISPMTFCSSRADLDTSATTRASSWAASSSSSGSIR